MSRLEELFVNLRAQRRLALMAYLCAGDPDHAKSREALLSAASAGADILEVGWPFSDPVADGPVIQAASERALGHTRREDVLRLIRELREAVSAPIAVLSYVNPLLRHGLEETLSALGEAGADALVVPDLSLEESDAWRESASRAGIALVPFIAPTTTEERIEKVAKVAKGFVYAVALTGVTGARVSQSEEILPVVHRLKARTSVPVLAGFGIGDGGAAALWRGRGVDGVIAGSALVQALREGGPAAVGALVRELRLALDGAVA